MIGFSSRKPPKRSSEIQQMVKDAVNFADTWHYNEPEQTTYRLRSALNQLDHLDDLVNANHYAELTHRGAMLSSDLRQKQLSSADYGRWLSAHLQSLGTAKHALKSNIRSPWRDHTDWLGQSLAHSRILQNRQARMAYEQLAITTRIEQALLNHHNADSYPATTKSGYLIEKILPTSNQIVSKSERLIDHYYSPQIID